MAAAGGTSGVERLLLCRVGAKVCGISLTRVIETMRPLPVEPLAELASFIMGVAVIRGRSTPVVDARKLLGSSSEHAPQRFVTLQLGEQAGARVAALAVDSVVGVRHIETATLGELPPLVRDSTSQAISALGTLDAELLLLLEEARLLPETAWRRLEQEPKSA